MFKLKYNSQKYFFIGISESSLISLKKPSTVCPTPFSTTGFVHLCGYSIPFPLRNQFETSVMESRTPRSPSIKDQPNLEGTVYDTHALRPSYKDNKNTVSRTTLTQRLWMDNQDGVRPLTHIVPSH